MSRKTPAGPHRHALPPLVPVPLTSDAEATMILPAVVFGRALPITPMQILWINMVTAVTLALAPAFEPPDREIKQWAPRHRDEPLLGRFVIWRIGFVSVILVTGTFGLFIRARMAGYELEAARTMAVNALVMFEVIYLINVRHILAPALNCNVLFGNEIASAAVAVVIGLQLLLTCVPVMNALFGTAPLGPVDWLLVVLVSATVVPLLELEKFTLRRR